MNDYCDKDPHPIADVDDDILIDEMIKRSLNFIDHVDDDVLTAELAERGFKGAVLMQNANDFENAEHYRDRGDRQNALNSLGHALGKEWHYFLTRGVKNV